MIESGLKKLSTFHTKENPTNILDRDHLQQTSSCLLQRGQHEHHHHAQVMEIDQTSDKKRVRQHHPHSPSLDTRGEAELRVAQEHLAPATRQKGRSRPSVTPGGPFRGWPRTDRSGVPQLCLCPTCQSAKRT